MGARHSHPEIGGVDATSKRSREASFDGADGVVGRGAQALASAQPLRNGTCSKKRIPKHFGNADHPDCAAAVASHLFLDGAAPLYFSGQECRAQFIHILIDRPYNTQDLKTGEG